jgi:hypothetical protein
MDLEHFDIVIKHGSDITLGGLLLLIIRMLYSWLKYVMDKFNSLVEASLKNCQEGSARMEAQFTTTLQAERKGFEENRKWEREFFLSVIEEKNALIEAKEDQIKSLIGIKKIVEPGQG